LEKKEKEFYKKISPENAEKQLKEAEQKISEAKSTFAGLEKNIQDEVVRKTSFKVLVSNAELHLEKAKKALNEEKIGRAFGLAISALRESSKAINLVEKIKFRLKLKEKQKEKFEEALKDTKQELPLNSMKNNFKSSEEKIEEEKKVENNGIKEKIQNKIQNLD